MLTILLAVTLAAAPFPLPMVDGKPLAVTSGQTRFLVPIRFENVRAFYASELDDPKVSSTLSHDKDGQVLTLVSRRPGDTWKKAVVREGAMGTEVVVTPVLRLEEAQVTGNGKPLVEFVLGRSHDVDRAVEHISDSHLESLRH